ncbi:YopX family protein [Bacillus thuringiensis]|nr:YopX family protein [Bacillus thuringiensis]MED2756499.1 YopX family protein [Bacillus thuringiensis]MED2769880.1 YopX family protein [Bacillus thuringiensis]MED2774132.1 YopX family protein [Bacillus thuringiensis]MED2783603.1 YopX family protein [Bacillus thuringiensis]
MDDIKFRAWDKVMEKMYEVGFIDFAKERVQLAHIVAGVCYAVCIAPLKDIELLQYTGIKDAKGNEIYEGDIVYQEFHDRMEETDRFTGAVKQMEGVWCICNGIDHAESLWSELNPNDVKGNIYENLELLENWTK